MYGGAHANALWSFCCCACLREYSVGVRLCLDWQYGGFVPEIGHWTESLLASDLMDLASADHHALRCEAVGIVKMSSARECIIRDLFLDGLQLVTRDWAIPFTPFGCV